MLVTPPKGCNVWTGPVEAKGPELLLDYHMGAGTQALGTFFAASPEHQQGAGSDVEQPGLKLGSIYDFGTKAGSLTHYTTELATRLSCSMMPSGTEHFEHLHVTVFILFQYSCLPQCGLSVPAVGSHMSLIKACRRRQEKTLNACVLLLRK